MTVDVKPMEMNFCRRCGTPLENIERHVFRCTNGHILFANSSPTAGIFIMEDDRKVLLSVRGIEPRKGMLDSFGGFLDGAETFEAAAVRELEEELSLMPEDFEELRYLTSGTGTYPYRGEILPVISVFFWTRLKTDAQPAASDDVAETTSVPLHEIDLSLMHDEDTRHGIRELRKLFPKAHDD